MRSLLEFQLDYPKPRRPPPPLRRVALLRPELKLPPPEEELRRELLELQLPPDEPELL
jgi:hypothetical protein